MNNDRTRLYEGMFLFPQSATAQLQEAVDHIKDILGKCDATILTLKKWDDRRLAYEINGNKRGVYFLVFFNAPTSAISEIERRCNQSEKILRLMVTKAEHLPTELIEANDGTEALATEIKLRGEKSAVVASASSSTVSRKEDQEPEAKAAPEPVEESSNEVVKEAPTQVAAEETTTEAPSSALLSSRTQ